MEQKERLIEILSRYFQIGDSYAYNLTRDKEAFSVGTMDLDDFEEFDEVTVADIAEYLTANGVIVPPCKVGQTVWFIRNEKIIETKVDKIVLKYGGLYLLLSCNSIYETTCRSIGKTVFLTREEAEKALAESGKP